MTTELYYLKDSIDRIKADLYSYFEDHEEMSAATFRDIPAVEPQVHHPRPGALRPHRRDHAGGRREEAQAGEKLKAKGTARAVSRRLKCPWKPSG